MAAHLVRRAAAAGRGPVVRSWTRALAAGTGGGDGGKLDPNVGVMDGDFVQQRGKDRLNLNFDDYVAAFRSKTNWEIVRGFAILSVCRIKPIVENNKKLMDMTRMMMPDFLFKRLMKATFYGQFVAGEDEEDIKPTINRLHSFGVKAILDYSAEEDETEEEAGAGTTTDVAAAVANDQDDATLTEALGHDVRRNDALKRFAADDPVVSRRKGVSSARTFYYRGEAQCERNMEIFLNSIDAVADATGGIGYAAIKVTALGRPQILLQLSEALMRTRMYVSEVLEPRKPGDSVNVLQHHVQPTKFAEILSSKLPEKSAGVIDELLKNMTYDQQGIINMFSWGGLIENRVLLSDLFKVPSLKTGKLMPLIDSLTDEENRMFSGMLRRMNNIFTYATNANVRVMVDAEQTYFQPAISRLTMEMMRLYNKSRPIVFNTYQCYLKNAHDELTLDLEQANRQDFYFGAKLVRGAYMDQERERAKLMGYEDPVNPHYDATSEMYHKCLQDVLLRAREHRLKHGPDAQPKASVMVASHNEDTLRFAVRKMIDYGIPPNARTISFGQLLGMCDHLSFPLGQAGYSVYKYVPYGPILEVMPYLSRRVTENGGTILTKSRKERGLMVKELLRRFVTLKWVYTPRGDYKPT